MPRTISLSRTGRYVALRSGARLELADALGTAPRVELAGEAAADFVCFDTVVWVLRGRRIERHALAEGRTIGPAIELPEPGAALLADRGAAHAAVVAGARPVLVLDARVLELDHAGAQVFPLAGRRVVVTTGDELRIVEPGRVVAQLRVARGPIAGVRSLFGGRLLAVQARIGDRDVWTVLRADGSRVHEIVAPAATAWAIASDAGTALGLVDGGTHWQWIDLRYGSLGQHGPTPFSADELDLSADGRYLVFAQAPSAADPARIAHLAAVALVGANVTAPAAAAPDADARPRARSQDASEPASEPAAPPDPAAALEAIWPRADEPPRGTVVTDEATREARSARLAAFVPLGFGQPPALDTAADPAWPPYGSAREHLDDLFELVRARAIAHAHAVGLGTAIAQATGVSARERADGLLAEVGARVSGRTRSSLAAGVRLPFIDLLRELDLSPVAGHVVMIALAPFERGEIAELFRAITHDAQRPIVDRALIEALLAGSDRARRAEVADALAPEGRLVRFGVLAIRGTNAFAELVVDPAVIARLCERIGQAWPSRALAELELPDPALHALLDAVAAPRPVDAPLRLIVRGRRGAGRRSVIAALAARAGRACTEIDCTRLPRTGAAMAAALHDELRRAALCGRIPIVSHLELADGADAEGQDRLRHALAVHAGPIVVRAPLEATLPLEPGFASVTIPPLSESERAAFWRRALARAEHPGDADALAARWRLGPGQIEDVIAAARATGGALDELARQHVARRMGHVATPVRRLPTWETVALADDITDSIRELIGRVAHRKTVLDHWGFDARLPSSRGLTALFYGPPGTGKTLVAGLIARELGLELYRVDLSRVLSKWVGETEKNLAEVFDAAEDGQVVLLFDEADSLFARRSEVKSSNDRYANLEVNYLLQRLDSFEGIAILTTNLDASIDPAFKRRLSMRLHFPFPDEELRKRLWVAHVPPTTPTARDFDFDELARRFPLSGGYIRNSALRAAFLAAQERRPLAHDHFLRAIALEYRELGRLAPEGRLE